MRHVSRPADATRHSDLLGVESLQPAWESPAARSAATVHVRSHTRLVGSRSRTRPRRRRDRAGIHGSQASRHLRRRGPVLPERAPRSERSSGRSAPNQKALGCRQHGAVRRSRDLTTITDAILHHAGEARASRMTFRRFQSRAKRTSWSSSRGLQIVPDGRRGSSPTSNTRQYSDVCGTRRRASVNSE